MKTTFKDSDISSFSLLSHDSNPLHMDDCYARKSAHGQRVVFGALGALRCLEQLKLSDFLYIKRLEVEFPNPIFIGVEYDFRVEQISSEKARIELCDGKKILLRVNAHFGTRQASVARATDNAPEPSDSATTELRKSPQDYQPADFLNEVEVAGQYLVNSAFLVEPPAVNPLSNVPLLPADVLMLCSYIIGMELPGTRALFSKLDLSFVETQNSHHPLLSYRAAKHHYDEAYGLLSVELNVAVDGCKVVTGELKSFVRNDIAHIELAQIEALLQPATSGLAGKVALVIGGSRGLGATMVRALALSGCHVVLNFTHSVQQATAIEREFEGKQGSITLLQGDAGDTQWGEQAKQFILNKFRRLDVLICNACQPPASLGDITSDRAREYITKNLALSTQPIAAFVDLLEASKGTLVGISSSILETETEVWPEYRETKRQVEAAIQAAAQAQPQISCLIARPPALITDMSNTPIRLMNAMRPEIVGVAVVNALVNSAMGEGESQSATATILNTFAVPSQEPAVPAQTKREKIILAATFTVEPVLESLAFWKHELDLSFDVELAPYNQVFQELLSPDTLFSRNTAGMNAIIFRFEDWLHELKQTQSIMQNEQYLCERLIEFVDALESFSQRSAAQILLLICPSFSDNKALQNIYNSLKRELLERLSAAKGLDVLIMERFHQSYGISEEIQDAERNELAHIPFTSKYFAAIGSTLIRRYYALIHQPLKVIVVDCDNTLWGGVCGEISPTELNIGGRFEQLQNFLKQQYQQGKILCLCSKNVDVDVWKVFEQRAAMPLKRDHIVDFRINWDVKSENIRSLASSLKLGLDSFIFIDDNPLECAEVRANCPEVLTLQWAADDLEARHTLDHLWLLDSYVATEEDKKRSEMYKANIKRESLLESTSDFDTFLKNLNLQIEINDYQTEDLARISQLTQRTNQFNFTTIRRTENQIRQLAQDDKYQVLTVKVSDKFGDYGLVGVVVLQRWAATLNIDSFMLSCRVLGRGVEHKILAEIGTIAANQGIATVTVLFNNSKKNLPARQFLEQCGIVKGEQKNLSIVIPAQQLQAIKHPPQKAPQTGVLASPKTANNLGNSLSGRIRERHLAKIVNLAHDIDKLYQALKNFHPQPVLPDTLRAQKHNSLQTCLLEEVSALFGNVLSINPQEIDAEENLERYVTDSFANVELTVELRKAFGKLPATYLFEHRSVLEIVDNLLATQGKQLAAKYGISEVADKPTSHTPQQYAATTAKPSPRDNDIAIIGIEGRFPQADTLQAFWQNLVQGRECIGEIPAERWDVDYYFDPKPQPGKSYSKWGGFLSDIDRFDASIFCISPSEAELMDPQQRLLLQTVWGLLENAAYTRKTINRKTGVFIGVNANDYINYTNETALAGLSSYRYSDFYQLSNRLSYFFDFKGPSITLDTACSSSGTSIHLACKSLLSGDCETAVVGAVNVFLHPSRFVQYAQMKMLSRDNKCRPFGAGASGTVFGEGVGALLLKPLSAAERDSDHIHGIIKGSAINAGGKTNGFTVPNPQAHAELVSTALTQAKIDSRTVSYIEAHGTGTPLGDPIEIRGLQMAFSANINAQYSNDKQYCSLGTIKANIGHLEAAAGMAGMIKVLLQMHNKTLVPSLNAARLNPEITFEDSPFYVQQQTAVWKRPVLQVDGKSVEIPRRAGISTFGAGGSNAHVVLEEYQMPAAASNHSGSCIIVLSALEDEQLQMSAARLAQFLALEGNTHHLCDIAYTLQVGREAMDKRLALVVASVPELIEKLSAYGNGAPADSSSEPAELAQIAQNWVSGKQVDWLVLYAKPLPQRIPLPSHPFAGERYWVPRMSSQKPGKLHPLVDAIELGLSLTSGIVFKKRFNRSELIVKDHQVNQQPVLPGVGYLAAVYEAAAQVVEVDKYCLEKVLWQKPLILEQDYIDVRIALNKQEEQLYFEISSDDVLDPVVFASGKLSLVELSPALAQPSLSLDEIKARCNSSFDKPTIYTNFEHKGFSYGLYFQGLSQVWFNDQEALGKISLPAQFAGELEQYKLQPTLADAALQTSLHLFPEASNAVLPFAVDRVERLRQLPENGYAYVRRNGNFLFVVDIVDEQGDLCLRFHDLALRELNDPLQRFFYAPTWQETSPVVAPTAPAATNTLLVYSDASAALKDALVSRLNGDRLFELQLGTETLKRSDTRWQAKADDAEAIDICIASLTSLNNIYFLGGIHTSIAGDDFGQLQATREYGILSLFRLLKSLDKHGFSQLPLTLKVVTNNVFALREEQATIPWSAGVFSLAKSIAIEYSQISVAAIDIDLQESDNLVAIVRETASNKLVPVMLRGGKRYLRSVEAITLPATEKSLFKQNGVYLILGGAGGLGFELSCFLAQTVQARLIWLGRRDEDAAISRKLERIKQLDGDAVYLSADAADPDSMARALAVAKARFGNIHGVIHSAAALHDRTLVKMEERDFSAALQAKMEASVMLSELLRDEAMDFMLFFSSVNSFTAAMGQSNYSAGCCFSDAYARYLNGKTKFPVKTINWGYWGSVGIAASAQDNRRMTALGHQSIAPKQGMEAMLRILANARVQVIAAKADDELLADIGVADLTEQDAQTLRPLADKTTEVASPSRFVSTDELFERAVDYVKSIFEKVLKIQKRKLDDAATFERYGIDSLISLQIIQTFEKDVGSLSPTLLFENIRIKELAAYFCSNHTKSMEKIFALAPAQPLPLDAAKLAVDKIILPQKNLEPPHKPSQASHTEDIAIIGLSGKFPMSDTLDAFWENICDGKNCISEVPQQRWDWERYYDSAASQSSAMFRSKWGGFISDVDKFDPLFFNIAPVDAEIMDPQQRLFLETAWKTMEDAGYTRAQLTAMQDKHDKGIGVYVGCMYQQYPFVVDDPKISGNLSAFSYWYIPNRVSAFLDLRGPSLAVDSACSSSLTAIHMACESIKSGECLMAFAGGVNLNLHPSKFALLSRMGILASTDHNRSLGDGDGYIPGEGVGAVLLKSLSLAIQDKDHIYAVIKGSAINHGGKTSGLTVPNPKQLSRLFSTTLQKSKIDPRAINYIEVAANGSPMGDPIEFVALNNVFKAFSDDKNYCALGAVKSNVGHLEAASGMSQLSKVLYQLKHQSLAPSLNAEPLNPKINLADSCFYVQKELAEWKRSSIIRDGKLFEFPRTAAITAIGAGGSNAHLIVQEYKPLAVAESQAPQNEYLIVLSARNTKGLTAYATELFAFLNKESAASAFNNQDESDYLLALQQDLLAQMSRLLDVPPTDIGIDQEFVDYGCDEVVLSQLSGEINQKYGLDSLLNDWVEQQTLENCVRYLLDKYRAALILHFDRNKAGQVGESKADSALLALNDIAYTLQVGREAMKERLAIVASSKRQLMQKLAQYSTAGADDDCIIEGNVSNSSPLAKTISDSVQGNDFIGKVTDSGNLYEIAQLWVSGIQIDWERLYANGNKPLRKPLPTYPFARDSYWIKPTTKPAQAEPSVVPSKAYPTNTPQTTLTLEQPTPSSSAYLSGDNLLDTLKYSLMRCVAQLLKVDQAELENDTDLQEYGFDSINLAGFAAAINAQYQLELTADVFLAYPTISSCATFLLKNFHDVCAAHHAAQNNTTTPVTPSPGVEQAPHEISIKQVEQPKSDYEPVAIIGISGIMPCSDDLDDFWENLKSGHNLISEMPAERWDWQAHYGKQPLQADSKALLWGGFLNHIDKFDNLFFSLSPREAELMDPQQRLFLQTVWRTIENAGYAVSDLAGSNTGLFVGVSCHDYEQVLHKLEVQIEPHTSTSLMVHSILANRLSYMLDFHGPSEIVDTACSSSTVAVHRAVRAIQCGDCALAIAGGVNVLLDPQGFFTLNEAGILSSTRDVKLFHPDGEGYLRGEGVAAVLLKPLSKAVADRDHIYAAIKGSDVNHDGKSFSLTSPNPLAQANVVKSAYNKAGFDPTTVSYIEAQGTGSPIGDPVEINAFKSAFQDLYQQRGIKLNGKPHCGIGYLKPSIGHLESAYGISAIIKVLLSMENRMLPASRNINEQGSTSLLKDSPFYMVTQNQDWEQLTDQHGNALPRRAGIHAFGVGGVNAHIVLEEQR